MKFGLFGYGKMGKAVEAIARQRSHEFAFAEDIDFRFGQLADCEVLIDFSVAAAAANHLERAAAAGIPLVLGTTGIPDVTGLAGEYAQSIGVVYASNYSLGMNLFLKAAETLISALKPYPMLYDVAIAETHHREKKDQPSGTALMIAELVLQGHLGKNTLSGDAAQSKEVLDISSTRVGKAFGHHELIVDSEEDTIVLTHTAKSRQGFALGAVVAAEWLRGKQGLFAFKDVVHLCGMAAPN